MRVRLLAASAAMVLALAGCTARPTGPFATATPTAAAVTALVPVELPSLDQTTAGTEAKRLADAIQALVASSEIVYVDDHAQYTAATGEQPAYYGVIRIISIEPADDPNVTAATMVGQLEASGWHETHTTDENGLTLTALVATTSGQTWLVLLGGDSTVEGQSAIDLELASPDLP